MKKVSLFSIAIILFAFASVSFAGENEKANSTNASAKISGKVIDQKTGEALAGVLIRIDDLNLTSYTDLDGNFEINNLTPGKYEVTGTLISYEKTGLVVEADNKSANLKVSLKSVSWKK